MYKVYHLQWLNYCNFALMGKSYYHVHNRQKENNKGGKDKKMNIKFLNWCQKTYSDLKIDTVTLQYVLLYTKI